MTLKYSVKAKINGVWKEIENFHRDIYFENPLDEELDTSSLDMQARTLDISEESEGIGLIPPFTHVRIEIRDEDNDELLEKLDYVTGDRDTTWLSCFKERSVL